MGTKVGRRWWGATDDVLDEVGGPLKDGSALPLRASGVLC